jgi:hypothetical protein
MVHEVALKQGSLPAPHPNKPPFHSHDHSASSPYSDFIRLSPCYIVLATDGVLNNKTLSLSSILGKGKGKAIPLKAWTGPEVSRSLRLPDFKTIGT